MKLYMLWDMEGVSGLFRREQTWHWEERSRPEDYEEGRTLLIDDINSAARAALGAGVDELIVTDTHSGGRNIRLDRMHHDPRVTYCETASVRVGNVRHWMPGLDTCDGIVLPGHHAKARTAGAFLPHTWMGHWDDVRINGISIGEIGLESCYAGHWDVPFILSQGDDHTEREVRAQYPTTVFAAVKRAEGHDRCSGPDAAAGRAITAERIAEAVEKTREGRCEPVRFSLPMAVSIRMNSVEHADKAMARPGAHRDDDRTVSCLVKRQCDVLKWMLDVGIP